jgi:hypothetical protein
LHIIGLILKVRKTKGKELLKKYNKRLIWKEKELA